MGKVLQTTADGSHTLYVPTMNVTYHSMHGAMQQSKHVFIQEGLDYVLQKSITASMLNIFEMGFGTGLNALLTAEKAIIAQKEIYYETIDMMPLEQDLYAQLNYDLNYKDEVHNCDWEKNMSINPWFTLHKVMDNLLNHIPQRFFDLVYYDAFVPTAQPELWTENIFKKLLGIMKTGGVLVTHCCKSYVRRNMLAAGFLVEEVIGPSYKKEMLRAVKA